MKKPSKYLNRKTELDGISFASKAESERYAFLKLRQRVGQISELKLQPRFPLEVGGVLIATYVADFEYVENGTRIVEDVKSVATERLPLFRMKAKLFEALNKFPITIVGKGLRA